MRKLAYIFLLIFFISCSSTRNAVDFEKPKVIGKASWSEWKLKSAWENTEAVDFEPDESDILKLSILFGKSNYSFVVFASSNCEDCIENLPKIYKILNLSGIDNKYIMLYGVDENLEEPSGFFKNFDIPTTPCMFVLKSGKEIGLITYPDYNWLEEMINIIEDDLE